jgi:hypothetical protein
MQRLGKESGGFLRMLVVFMIILMKTIGGLKCGKHWQEQGK